MSVDSPRSEELPCELFCFQHCRNIKIYCFFMPNNCPICSNYLDSTEFHIPPFRIHLPLVNKPSLDSLVLKPSVGSFTENFVLGKESLHIGITNSQGLVYEYDKHGLLFNFKPSNWHNHVAISLFKLGISCKSLDNIIDQMKSNHSWTAERYDDAHHNCFDFAVEVLNACREVDSAPFTKLKLAEEVMIPVLKRVLNMLSLFHKVVSADGIFYQA